MIIRETHLIPDGVEAVRLSDYARTAFASLVSRKGTDKAIKRGEMLVDGNPGNTGDWVKSGQLLKLMDLQQRPPKPFYLPLDIVYEDEDLAVINKPPGFEVSGNKFKTIENALSAKLQTSKAADALPWPRPVHRLDYATSGLLLVAKTAGAQVHLGKQFENRTVKKVYSAIVNGRPEPEGQIDEPIGGLPALSHFKTVQTIHSLKSGELSLVQLSPHTGRTHQLRIHMASLGHPIAGDQKYGPEGQVLRGKGLFLAAVKLTFLHPATEKTMTIQLDAPHKFTSLLEREQRRWEKFHA